MGKLSAKSPKGILARERSGIKRRKRDGADVAITGRVEIDGKTFSFDRAIFHFTRKYGSVYNLTVGVNSTEQHIACLAQLAKSKGWFSPRTGFQTLFQ